VLFRSLPGVGVRYSAQTAFEGGTAADLVNGVLVFAKGRYDAPTKAVVATWIEVVKTDASVPRVAGPVSEFVSLANFRIGGQSVDAAGATILDGTAADVGNGVVVLVQGQLVDRDGKRVLVAQKLRVMQ
jgi:hypothetical protein